MIQRPLHQFYARNYHLELGRKTLIMGIVNCSPDSFSLDGFSPKNPKQIVTYALSLVKQGADIIDIGGESTRPGAVPVNVHQEIQRVVGVIELLSRKTTLPISIDTYKPAVALAALEAGASIVNTVRGSSISSAMVQAVKRYQAGLILMHSRGNSVTMASKAHYKDFMGEVAAELNSAVKKCLDLGVEKDRIIIDPGLGFAKTVVHNIFLMRNIKHLHKIGYPILVGPSRKSFIGHILNKEVHQRLMGTAACVSASIVQGAHVVRVHDVKHMRELADMTDAILTSMES